MLIRKMLRDIWKNKVQFLAIFLMMFLGCFLYSGITGEWNGLSVHFEQYIEDQNLADAWVYGGAFTRDDIKKLQQDSRVEDAQGRMLFPVSVEGKENASLDCYAADEDRISRLHISSGSKFDSSARGVWLDQLFAEANGYGAGDWITLEYQGTEIKGNILGLADSPEYIYGATEAEMAPNHEKKGFIWISPELLPMGSMPGYNQIAVNLVENEDVTTVIREILGADNISVLKAKDHPAVSMITDEIQQHRTIGTAFSAAFLLIALMITMTTTHRMLKNQRTQTGILKALGFTKRKLVLHYLSHNVAVCMLGAIAGSAVGYKVMPGLIYGFMKKLYVLPDWGGVLPADSLWLPAGCVIILVCISFTICRGYLRGAASENLYAREGLEKSADLPKAAEKLPFKSLWNMRDILRNKLRSFMTLCGVLGCTALLFCAFALFDTFTNLSDWTFTRQQAYECKVTDLADQEAGEWLIDQMDGEYLMESSAVILADGKEEEVSLTVPESARYLKLAESLSEFTDIGEGIALSKKTAVRLGIQKGDTIQWKEEGSKGFSRSKVEAVVRTPLVQGIVIMRDSYEGTGQTYTQTSIIGQEPENGFGRYEKLCTVSRQSELTKGIDTMMDGMVMMISLLVSGAVILGSVMLYNLGVLSYLERYREFATLKVLGLADRKIRKIMIQQNVWLSAAGILLGLPAGYGLLLYMLSTIPDSMDIPVYIQGWSWGFSVIGTLALSWLISRMVSRKIPGIDMVEALKGKE